MDLKNKIYTINLNEYELLALKSQKKLDGESIISFEVSCIDKI